jgi:hypothetical protein
MRASIPETSAASLASLGETRRYRPGLVGVALFMEIRHRWSEFPDACLQAHAGLRLEFADLPASSWPVESR